LIPPELNQANIDLQNAKAERDSAVSKLTGFNVSNDPALQNQLNSITAQWDARIAEMERINKSRTAAITTTGIRTGSRYTGGLGGVFGGIITEEERQGVGRISELQAQKQSALSAAQQAYENQQWERYSDLVSLAEQKYKDQLAAVDQLQQYQLAQDKLLQDKIATQQAKDDKLVKEARDLATYLAPQVVSFLTGDEEADAKNIRDFASQYDLDPNFLLSAAIKYDTENAKKSATGIIGEYEYYKNQETQAGRKPLSFDEYQTHDQLRKSGQSLLNTQVIESNGHKLLINSKTGAIIKDFGGTVGSNAPGGYLELTPAEQSGSLRAIIQGLPVGQQDMAFSAIATFKNAANLFDLLGLGASTGPLAGGIRQGFSLPLPFTDARLPLSPGTRTFGLSSPTNLDFDAAATAFTANFIKAISGVQVSDREREFLMGSLPSPFNQEDVNKENIKQLLEFLKNKYELQLGIKFENFPDEIPMPTNTAKLESLYNQSYSSGTQASTPYML